MTFSIREFLRDRRALLVHFSSIMTSHRDKFPFPNDLKNAAALRDKALSFCTVQSTDHWPFQKALSTVGEANAAGNVGIVVDVKDADCVTKVAANDQGSFDDEESGRDGDGHPPSLESCSHSIDARQTCNEWLVKNYIAIGVLVLPPYVVPSADFGEQVVKLGMILESFPELRIFSIDEASKTFTEYDRQAASWSTVSYDGIVGW
jgi:hypothetical protein